MYNVRKSRSNKKKSKPSDSHHHTNNIWTVQMPKRMLFGTMGIFLLIPVLVFVYKEMHLPKKSELVRGNHDSSSSSSSNMSMMKKSNQEYVSWMANFLGNEETEDDDAVGAVDVNETTIDQDRSDTNDNETTGGGDLNDKNDDDAEIKESDGTTTTGTKGVDREDVHEKEEDENG